MDGTATAKGQSRWVDTLPALLEVNNVEVVYHGAAKRSSASIEIDF